MEAAVQGARFTPTRHIPNVLGTSVLEMTAADEFEVAAQISAGLPISTVHSLARSIDRPSVYVLKVAGIPESSFHDRRKKDQALSPDASSRVYQVARAVEAAETYFDGDQEAARRWLTHPKSALGGAVPLEFARTPQGSDYVVKLLDRMAHGVIS